MKKKEKKKKQPEGECYFCNADLKSVDRKKKTHLECCGISVHSMEIYSWFLRNQYCPNCLSTDKRARQKILDWGMNKEKSKTKQTKIKTLEHKLKRFEKGLR